MAKIKLITAGIVSAVVNPALTVTKSALTVVSTAAAPDVPMLCKAERGKSAVSVVIL